MQSNRPDEDDSYKHEGPSLKADTRVTRREPAPPHFEGVPSSGAEELTGIVMYIASAYDHYPRRECDTTNAIQRDYEYVRYAMARTVVKD
ncbi:hypothetical protein FOZ63_026478 [Perkinsus olseni]|uniref:Uncharacterized protein n=1 Tax=Perkinsus olseni TaxID=32597 RepID=A0A7J6SHR1_PEROL|nr:hypothetical protein FOZ63_026478 [Perkinsus olseni]KAF4736056.1 hypothetical protein FOZ62_028678 [Perkinsus olseni]